MHEQSPTVDPGLDVLGPRAVAAAVDFLLATVVAVVPLVAVWAVWLLGFGGGFLSAAVLGLAALTAFVLWFAYFVYFEGKRGQTLGKRLMGVVVVREDGSPCGYGAAAVRTFTRLVDGIGVVPYLVGLIVVLVTDRNQRLGDLLAGTVVVRAE